MTGSISGKLWRLAIVKYNGIRVKTVISLVKNIADTIDKIVKINGYALCHITAGEKDFDINYYSTNEGIISSGSEVFKNSVLNYIDEDVYVKICKLKTKKGITYKVSPILVNEETGEVE